MARYYPVYLNMEARLGVVVGGGPVAERKVLGLLEGGARVRVVSPELTPELQALAHRGQIEVILERYQTEHLEGAALVFAATNVREVNARIASDAQALHLPVNVADAPEASSFIVPSVVRRGEFCLSVSTGGNQPMLAARIAREMEARFGPEYGAFVELLGAMRDTIKQQTEDPALRRAALAAILDHEAEIRSCLAAARLEEARAVAIAVVTEIVVSPPGAIEDENTPLS